MDPKYEWIITKPIVAQSTTGDEETSRTLVYDQDAEHAVIMSVISTVEGNTPTPQLMFNGEYCDVGDDLTQYLAIMEEADGQYPHKILCDPSQPERFERTEP